MKPTVSVIMSVYDGVDVEELRAAIGSILGQSYRNLELLIMLDGVLNPNLIGTLDNFMRQDERIRALSNSVRRGLAYSLNRLLTRARGQFIARMDADDISLSTRFEEQVEWLISNPEILILGTFAQEIDSQGNVLFEKTMPLDATKVRTFMARRDPFIHPTVMFRREFFDQVGLYSEDKRYSFLEDTELWSRAILAGCGVANLEKYLFSFRISSNFYDRRRGISYLATELTLRLRYIFKAELPPYYFLFPFLVAIVRLCPSPILRLAYKRARL